MTFIATTGNDNWTAPQYGEININIIDGLAGVDTLSFGPLLQSRFTITRDSAGVVTVASVSGASSTFYYRLINVEFLSFNNGGTRIDLSTYFGAPATDTTAPTVTSFAPAPAATAVAVNANIVLTFSEAVQKGTGLIQIHSGSATGTVVESIDVTSANVTISGSTVTITPTLELNGTHYYVTFPSGVIKDLAGNAYAGTTAYDFTTVAAADTTAPTVISVSPTNGSTAVAVNATIMLTFSEAVHLGSGTIELRDVSGTLIESFNVASTSNVTVSGSIVTINPTLDLANGTLYTIHLNSGVIVDLAGNPLQVSFDTLFATIASSTSSGSSGGESENGEFESDVSELSDNHSSDSLINNEVQAPSDHGLVLTGDNSANVLTGGLGNDVLTGGGGSDILTGGGGADIFDLSAPLNKTAKDIITDFEYQDKIQLNSNYFKLLDAKTLVDHLSLDGVAHGAQTYLIYNPSNGNLIYDVNGSATGGQYLLAEINMSTGSHPHLTIDNFIVI